MERLGHADLCVHELKQELIVKFVGSHTRSGEEKL